MLQYVCEQYVCVQYVCVRYCVMFRTMQSLKNKDPVEDISLKLQIYCNRFEDLKTKTLLRLHGFNFKARFNLSYMGAGLDLSNVGLKDWSSRL